jgi:sterol desaturase/sphingolipid hydroxylase (fatty acid hydroxylase superfamily)
MVRADATAAARADEALPEPHPEVEAARRFVRGAHLDADYSPWRHIGRTLAIAAVIGAFAGLLAARARPLDWLLMPIFFVVANFIEWAVHRYPMHRPLTPRLLYKNHAQMHHIAFTDRNMTIGPVRELGLIMMPWYTMLGLFAVASPVMVLAAVLRGPGLAGVFLLGAVAYFLTYETLHALYHLPDATLDRMGVGRLRLFRTLQAHHRHHHVLRRMADVNFNVTVPLMDHLFGTAERGAPPSSDDAR